MAIYFRPHSKPGDHQWHECWEDLLQGHTAQGCISIDGIVVYVLQVPAPDGLHIFFRGFLGRARAVVLLRRLFARAFASHE